MELDSLEIKITSGAADAADQIDKLSASLSRMKSAAQSGAGLGSVQKNLEKLSAAVAGLDAGKLSRIASAAASLGALSRLKGVAISSSVANQLRAIGEAAGGMEGSALANLRELVSGLDRLQAVGGVKISSSIATQLKAIGQAADSLSGADLSGLARQTSQLRMALEPLSGLKRGSFTGMISSLGKIGEISDALGDAGKLDAFAAGIRRVAQAMEPLADQASKVYVSLKWLPGLVERAAAGNLSMGASFQSGAKQAKIFGSSIRSMGLRSSIGAAAMAVDRTADVISTWLSQSNAYVENLNLFTVAMGDYAGEAQAYAEEVTAVMGIDPSAWMRNQGVFMTLADGFGVASEEAAFLSKNLTQLGYDLSSFFNISVEDAMQKLQSGISGELEPLRRLGFDLSQARLQSVALANGIDESVASMTQAQKSQLRYIAIMTQVTSAQGDMARTLESPANQLRIFTASVDQAARALGNVFIPALNAVLPYAIALVDVVRWAAQSLAEFLGFSLPEVDYSGVENVASAGAAAEDSLSGAAGAAKDLKNYVMGFDELNILAPPEENVGAGSGAPAAGGGFDLDLPGYDFLGDAVDSKAAKIFDSIKDSLEGVFKALDKISPLLEGIVAAIAVVQGMKLLKNLSKAKGVLGAVGGALGIAGGVLGTVVAALAAGFGPLDAFRLGWYELQTRMQNLSPFTKATVALAGLTAEAVVVYNAVKDLAAGEKTLGEALLNIVPAVSGVGILLTAMLGPIGAVATGFVGLVSAVLGYNAAQDEMRKAMVEETFFDGQGIAIGELSDRYVTLMESVSDSYDAVMETKEALDASREAVEEAGDNLEDLFTEIDLGLITVEDAMPQIIANINSLYDATRDSLEATRDLLNSALVESFQEGVVSSKEELREISDATNRFIDEQIEQAAYYAEEMEKAAAAGDTLRVAELQAEMDKISGAFSEGQQALMDFQNDMSNIDIDWSSLESGTEGIEQVEAAMKTAMDRINGHWDTVAEEARLQLGAALEQGDEEAAEHFRGLLETFEEARGKQLSELSSYAGDYVYTLQSNLLRSFEDAADAAAEEWDSMSWLQKAFSGGKQQYIEESLQDFRENTAGPLAQQIQEQFEGALTEDDLWAQEAMNGMLSALFTTTAVGKGHYVTTMAGDVGEAIDAVLPPRMRESGVNAAQGLADGLAEGASQLGAVTSTLARTILDRFDTDMEIHSPSAVMAARGIQIVAGLVEGIASVSGQVAGAIAGMVSQEVTGNIYISFDTLLLNMENRSILFYENLGAQTTAFSATVQTEADVLSSSVQQKTDLLVSALKQKITDLSTAAQTSLGELGEKIKLWLEEQLERQKEFTSQVSRMYGEMASESNAAIQSIIRSLNSIPRNIRTVHTIVTRRVSGGSSRDDSDSYASGGFPTPGQLFLAREAGPELVGTIGGRTAVANNDQIVQGIAQGVYDAVVRAFQSTQGEGQPIVIELDGDKVGRSVANWQQRQGASITKGAFTYAY